MWHSFRFTAADTKEAYRWLQRALELDPLFARAFAALSFNHFSRAFLNATSDVDGDIKTAVEFAQRSVDLDGRDAMAHWALGRAMFLSAAVRPCSVRHRAAP